MEKRPKSTFGIWRLGLSLSSKYSIRREMCHFSTNSVKCSSRWKTFRRFKQIIGKRIVRPNIYLSIFQMLESIMPSLFYTFQQLFSFHQFSIQFLTTFSASQFPSPLFLIKLVGKWHFRLCSSNFSPCIFAFHNDKWFFSSLIFPSLKTRRRNLYIAVRGLEMNTENESRKK